MAPAKTPPLARSAASDVLDWEGVERHAEPKARDVFGFKDEDRLALGMSAARTVDLAPTLSGDAHAALVDALAKSAAISATRKRAR
jgi:hypothetical protein